jgi:hypothetical protein
MGSVRFFKAPVQLLPNLKNDGGIYRRRFSPKAEDPQNGGGQQ